MDVNVIVFDFDGTLVDSNRLKRQAFYQLFPNTAPHQQAVEYILDRLPEAPRREILSQILVHIGDGHSEEKVESLAQAYSQKVRQLVESCPERTGASALLERLSEKHALYLSSGTAQHDLDWLVTKRGWTTLFQHIYGHPHRKPEVLRQILTDQQADSSQVIVVGDGQSDEEAAIQLGCPFIKILEDALLEQQLACLLSDLGNTHV